MLARAITLPPQSQASLITEHRHRPGALLLVSVSDSWKQMDEQPRQQEAQQPQADHEDGANRDGLPRAPLCPRNIPCNQLRLRFLSAWGQQRG